MKRFEIIENLYASKKFLKMAGGRMHLPHPTPSGFAPGIVRKLHSLKAAMRNLRLKWSLTPSSDGWTQLQTFLHVNILNV